MKSPTARDWTVADAYDLPEDGFRRQEVIDGELFASPPPTELHQIVAFELAVVLRSACPSGLRVYGGPINLDIGDRRHLEPDLAVKRVAGYGDSRAAPLLVVEILSPSNWRHDAVRKWGVYEELGVPSYWLVDPQEPSVRVLELREGGYVDAGPVVPGDEFVTARPFAVRLAPAEWTGDLG